MNSEHKIIHQKFVLFGSNAKEWMRKCVLLLPEIEKHRIWEQKHFGSIYEYTAKLAGMSRNTVDDALRILKKIEGKPALRHVVAIKGINAVRPLIAIATENNESFWAEKAMQMSRHTLEVYVKEFTRAGGVEEGWAGGNAGCGAKSGTGGGEEGYAGGNAGARGVNGCCAESEAGSNDAGGKTEGRAENGAECGREKTAGEEDNPTGEKVNSAFGEANPADISRTGTGNNAKKSQQQAISFFGACGEDDAGGADCGEQSNSGAHSNSDAQSNTGEQSNAGTGGGAQSNFGAPSKKIIAMDLEPEIISQLEKLKGGGNWNDLIKHLLQTRAAHLSEQKPQSVKTKSRYIPAKIQHYIAARTNGTCSFPRCLKPAKIVHHTQRFALEKTHDPDRLYPLCKPHEQLAHHGLIGNEDSIPDIWKIKSQSDTNIPKFKIDKLVAKYRGYG